MRESLKKCEEQLLEFEEKLGFAGKLATLDKAADALSSLDVSGDEREKLDKIIEEIKKITE